MDFIRNGMCVKDVNTDKIAKKMDGSRKHVVATHFKLRCLGKKEKVERLSFRESYYYYFYTNPS